MEKIKIQKAKKGDFEEYYSMKKEMLEEYSKIISQKIKLVSKTKFKKDFEKDILNKKNYIAFAREDKSNVGYLVGSIFKNDYNGGGEIEDLFVKKEKRKKGVAKKLIKEFSKELVKKKGEMILLDVNIKNNSAKEAYEKLGFKIIRYQMEKKLK